MTYSANWSDIAPGDADIFAFDLTAKLAEVGDTISAPPTFDSSVAVTPDSVTQARLVTRIPSVTAANPAFTFGQPIVTNGIVTVLITTANCIIGVAYLVSIHVVTSGGRNFTRSALLTCNTR